MLPVATPLRDGTEATLDSTSRFSTVRQFTKLCGMEMPSSLFVKASIAVHTQVVLPDLSTSSSM